MPKKIPFRVVYSTGWEDDYPPKDLEVVAMVFCSIDQVHSPFIKGWRSQRYCLYPQELVLRLDPPARVRKLQLLSHQYMIASKIDLYIGQLPSNNHSAIEHAQFKRLGYISLSDNEQTGYRSRELKSVNIDCYGHLVKLVLQPNHINRLNLFNQVSVVALNVIGDQDSMSGLTVTSSLPTHVTHYIEKGKEDPLSEVIHSYLPSVYQSQENPVLLGEINKPSNISMMDDLGFAVGQDPQTAELIRVLDSKKRTAVRDEEFQYAKQLKLVIDELQKIGEVLCRFEVEKKLAIEREDYDTAKQKKAHLDAIRKQVYEQLDIQGLLNNTTASTRNGHSTLSVYQDRSHPRVPRLTPFDGEQISHSGSILDGTVSHAPLTLPPIELHGSTDHTSPPRKQHTEDRPLPALVARTEKTETVREHQQVGGVLSGGGHRSDHSDDGGDGVGGRSVHNGVGGRGGGSNHGGVGGGSDHGGGGHSGVGGRSIHSGVGGGSDHGGGSGYGGVGDGSGEDGVGGGGGEASGDKPEPLTEDQLIKVPVAMEMFGTEVLEHVFSKQYHFREKGIQEVLASLESREVGSRKEVSSLVRAICEVLNKVLKDKVMSTFALGLDLLNHLVGPFTQRHRLGRPDLGLVVDKVMPLLLTRTGDTTPRIVTAAIDQITTLAEHQQIKTFAMIGPMLVRPFKQKKPPWRLAQGRVELLDRFYHNVGFESSGINVRIVMQFLSPLLSHPHGNVREPAIKLVFDLYRKYGKEVRLLLPVSDDVASRRKTLWKTIFEGFDRIDGVPTQAEREAAHMAAEKAKADEIRKLKGEVEALRQLAAQGTTQQVKEGDGESTTLSVSESLATAEAPPTSAEAPPSREEETQDTLETTCVFCGEQRREFADKGMESHYLQQCPMLQSCPYCSQVIEISGLTKHWVTECEAKAKFRECPNCGEAVLGKQYDSHMTNCKGHGLESGHTLCPLCHASIEDGEESWKAHLMGNGPKTCQKNPRRKGPASKRPALRKGGPSTTGRGTNIPRPGVRGTNKTRTK